MKRTFIQRLAAIPAAVKAGQRLRSRIVAAKGDPAALAALMAEAVAMHLDANLLEPVGRDGRQLISTEAVEADLCLICARKAFLAAATRANATRKATA